MREKLIGISICVLLVACLATPALGLGYLQNVPDWNQPTLVDANLPDPGPVNNVNMPAAGATTAWCVPTASANIMGYYRDTMTGLTIADNQAFPNTTARAPNAPDWRDDAVDDQSFIAPTRNDLGWYLNTNGQGDATMPFNPGMGGTHYGNVVPGLGSYFTAHNLAPSIINFADLNGPAVIYDNSLVAPPHTVAMSYQRIKNEIDAGQPLLLHLLYWNFPQRNSVRAGGLPALPDYDWGLWGPQVAGGPGGEVYGVDVGHTVTVVGYWDGADGNNPFIGMGNGGSNPDALIVYDDADGTLLSGGNATPLPFVIPYSTGENNVGLNAPWVMQTEISGVPEPATLFIVAAGAIGLLRRRRGA
jgi:hypothetical protein